MAKAHMGHGIQPDVFMLALQRRALTSGRRKPKAGVVPLSGDQEAYYKEDPEFGPMLVLRKKTSQIKSEKVKERNQMMRVCAAAVDEKITSKREGGAGVSRAKVRELFQKCLEERPTTIEEARDAIADISV